jgi:hypothetical protein
MNIRLHEPDEVAHYGSVLASAWERRRRHPVDDVMSHRLQEQESRLRAVMSVFVQAERRLAQLGGNLGWSGVARDAYDLGVFTLRAELRTAEDHLAAALAGTVNALRVVETTGQVGD